MCPKTWHLSLNYGWEILSYFQHTSVLSEFKHQER